MPIRLKIFFNLSEVVINFKNIGLKQFRLLKCKLAFNTTINDTHILNLFSFSY